MSSLLFSNYLDLATRMHFDNVASTIPLDVRNLDDRTNRL